MSSKHWRFGTSLWASELIWKPLLDLSLFLPVVFAAVYLLLSACMSLVLHPGDKISSFCNSVWLLVMEIDCLAGSASLFSNSRVEAWPAVHASFSSWASSFTYLERLLTSSCLGSSWLLSSSPTRGCWSTLVASAGGMGYDSGLGWDFEILPFIDEIWDVPPKESWEKHCWFSWISWKASWDLSESWSPASCMLTSSDGGSSCGFMSLGSWAIILHTNLNSVVLFFGKESTLRKPLSQDLRFGWQPGMWSLESLSPRSNSPQWAQNL